MMNKILTYGFLLSTIPLLMLLTACEEQILNQFEASPSLYFYRGTNNLKGAIQRDSVNYSFFLAGSRAVDTVWVDVRLTGSLSSEDRPLPIVQTNAEDENAAVAGRDYVVFDHPDIADRMVMPAHRTSVAVPIVVNRTTLMENTEYRLDLAITSNSYFVEGVFDQQTYTIKITAMATQPAMWENIPSNGYYTTFGSWGQEKMRFIIEYVGYSAFEEKLDNVDLRRFYNLKARRMLSEYLLTHEPLYEVDDTEVTFPQL